MVQKGIVKWFDDKKGYGFIRGMDGVDIFVHHKAILMKGRRTLTRGQRVTYSTKMTDKGIQAYNVRVVNE